MNWLIAAIVVLLAIYLFQQSPAPRSRRKRRTVARPRSQSLAFSDKEIKQIARKLGIGEARTRELAAKGRIRRL